MLHGENETVFTSTRQGKTNHIKENQIKSFHFILLIE